MDVSSSGGVEPCFRPLVDCPVHVDIFQSGAVTQSLQNLGGSLSLTEPSASIEGYGRHTYGHRSGRVSADYLPMQEVICS